MNTIPGLKRYVSGIYMITNTANGKVYVGSAVCIKKRLSEHISRLCSGTHHNRILQNAWLKYGADCFVSSILEIIIDKSTIAETEQKWIDFFKSASRNIGYNILKIAFSSVRDAKTCINCQQPSKPLRKGRCHKCNTYFLRNQKERPFKIDGRKERQIENGEKLCIRCARPNKVKGYAGRGLCKSCYRTIHKKEQKN